MEISKELKEETLKAAYKDAERHKRNNQDYDYKQTIELIIRLENLFELQELLIKLELEENRNEVLIKLIKQKIQKF